MFKALKEIVVVFNMMVLGTSGQDKGHKIIHFVSIYDSNHIRDYFWTQKQCSSLKCNLARRGKLLNRTKCLLKYIDRENSCQRGSCEPGNQA